MLLSYVQLRFLCQHISFFGIALSVYSAIEEPKSYSEAVKNKQWIEAMQSEIATLEENNTWSIIDLPSGKMPIGYRWVYKEKYTASGDVERYKASG